MKVTIYEVSRLKSFGWKKVLAAFGQLVQSREIIFQLAYRDFAVRYRQSFLGYLWAVLPQIVTVGIFTFLAGRRVFDMGETSMPYVVHALWSISLWQLFSGCIVNCTNSLIKAGSLVTKVNFPKECVVIASLAEPTLDFLIRLVPVLCVMLWLGFIPSIQIVWLPLIIMLVILFALGIGLIFSVLNLVLRDMGNAISMVLTFGMFLSPILYPPPIHEPFSWVNYMNPFSPLLITTQDIIAGKSISMPVAFSIVVLGIVLCLFVGWRVFQVGVSRVTERA